MGEIMEDSNIFFIVFESNMWGIKLLRVFIWIVKLIIEDRSFEDIVRDDGVWYYG